MVNNILLLSFFTFIPAAACFAYYFGTAPKL